MLNFRALCPVTCLLLALAGCGGGGGGGGGSGPAPANTPAATYTLSGTITLPETAAVDSDTNDPLQSNRASNNSFTTAQAIATPVQLVGTVNRVGAGPVGANYATGDIDDYFKTALTQGQVIEMSFIGGASADDIDMYLIEDGTTPIVVASANSDATAKCIKVSRTSTYYIRLQANSGSGMYTLRIGAPGDGNCGVVSTSTESIIPDELVAKAATHSTLSRRNDLMAAAGLEAVDGAPRDRPHLLRLPQNERAREKGLERLEALGKKHHTGRRQRSDAAAQAPRFARALRAMQTLEYAQKLMDTGAYDYVEPNFHLEMLAFTPTDDPLYIAQNWHYQQINQPSAMSRIDSLGLPLSTQRPIVAVIDSGVMVDHPDLQPQLVPGYSFISATTLGDGDMPGGDDPSTGAPRWHGTHVAGTIGAADNNVFGVGVAPIALLMPVRVFAPGKSASSFDVVQAIRYAAGLSNRSNSLPTRKADVINMSIGGQGSCPAQFSTEIANARAQNVVVVAAAGNDAHNDQGTSASVGQPANCPGVIAVGATDARKQQAFYSNSGAALTLMAPGGDAYQSTTGTGYVDAVYSTLGSFNTSGTRTPSFGPLMGTSMATPHVSGVIALMRYVYPAITPAAIDTLIANGQITDDLGVPGRDDTYGYGLINARKAVDEAIALASSGASSPAGVIVASPASISFGSVTTSATLELKLTAPGTETVTSVISNSAAVTVAPTAIDPTTKLGTYTVTVDRSKLPSGTSFPTLTITTSTRTFTVQLAIVKAATALSATASYGHMFVLVERASDYAFLGLASVQVSGGRYVWSIPGIPAGQVRIFAGTDLNNDGFICDLGEVCGIYPETADSITVNRNLSGLDFPVSPTGVTSSSVLNAKGVKASATWPPPASVAHTVR